MKKNHRHYYLIQCASIFKDFSREITHFHGLQGLMTIFKGYWSFSRGTLHSRASADTLFKSFILKSSTPKSWFHIWWTFWNIIRQSFSNHDTRSIRCSDRAFFLYSPRFLCSILLCPTQWYAVFLLMFSIRAVVCQFSLLSAAARNSLTSHAL